MFNVKQVVSIFYGCTIYRVQSLYFAILNENFLKIILISGIMTILGQWDVWLQSRVQTDKLSFSSDDFRQQNLIRCDRKVKQANPINIILIIYIYSIRNDTRTSALHVTAKMRHGRNCMYLLHLFELTKTDHNFIVFYLLS